MRPIVILFGILLAIDFAQAAGPEQEPLQAIIWNASDEDIIVVVQTPSRPDMLLRSVQVPSGTVVIRIPLPQVEDDLLAVAFRAQKTPDGLQLERPARIVGMRKLFPSDEGPVTNSTVPVLKYTAYESRSQSRRRGYSGADGFMPPLFEEEEHYHLRALWAPRTTVGAQDLVNEALQSATPIAYEEQERRE